ncbi:hypothetical protein D6D25_08138 [Aureobasidium pullulans]|nr:hypothetical protein D6D25_08138 [Aureobasidium pullulans]
MQSIRNPVNHGARFEGDLFSALRHSPYVVRSFEFALVDGAVALDNTFDANSNYADRFWRIDQQQRNPDLRTENEMLYFDGKSSSSAVAEGQVFLTTIKQRRLVAFYVCICANDPRFVELIPNRYQGLETPGRLETDEVIVNTARHSRLPPSAYRLDPSGSPRRLPLALLPEAIHRIVLCVRNQQDYVNPWTLVAEEGWRPQTNSSVEHLKPAEQTEHYSAYLAAMNIYRHVIMHAMSVPMHFDFVGLQPKLADFKLIFTDPEQRQFFVQHKLDARDRALSTPLTKVFIGRSKKKGIAWYFEPTERLTKRAQLICSLLTSSQVRFPLL